MNLISLGRDAREEEIELLKTDNDLVTETTAQKFCVDVAHRRLKIKQIFAKHMKPQQNKSVSSTLSFYTRRTVQLGQSIGKTGIPGRYVRNSNHRTHIHSIDRWGTRGVRQDDYSAPVPIAHTLSETPQVNTMIAFDKINSHSIKKQRSTADHLRSLS